MRNPARNTWTRRAAFTVFLVFSPFGYPFSASFSAPHSALAAEDPESWLEPGIAAYTLGMASNERDERLRHFSEAERFFSAAIQAGADSGDGWVNLGNAALQAERLGPAVLAYRRALILEPGNERATQNLAHARTLLPEWVPVPSPDGVFDTFFFWQRTVSRSARADWAAGAFAVSAALVSIGYAMRLAFPRYLGILFGLIWMSLMSSIYLRPDSTANGEGVVVLPEAVGRAADSINAPLRFGESLPSGSEVRILEDRGGWLHVELYNGRDAWVAASAIERVGESVQ